MNSGKLKIKVNKKEVFFYFALFLMMFRKFGSLLSIVDISFLRTYILIAISLLLVITIFINRCKIIEICFCVLGFYSYYIARDETLLFFFLTLFASKNISKESIIRFWFRLQSFVMIPCIVLYPILFILGSSSAITGIIGGRLRYFFFFNHPNSFSAQVVFWVLAYLYLKFDVLKESTKFILIAIATVFLYYFPNTITAVVSLIVFVFLLLLYGHGKIILRYFVRIGLPVAFIITIYITWMYYNDQSNWLTELIIGTLQSRFAGVAILVERYPMNLFGHTLSEIGELIKIRGEWLNYYADIAFVRVFSAFGIIGGITFLGFLFGTIFKEVRQRNYKDLIFLSVVCIYATSEWTAFSISTAFPLILISDFMYREKYSLKRKMGQEVKE